MPSESITPDIITAAFTGYGVLVSDRDFVARPGDADVLKFSAAVGAIIAGKCSSTGGKENACDVNNSSSVVVAGTLALNAGDQAGLVVKGGSSFSTAPGAAVTFTPSALSKTDILADDWSDQSQSASRVFICATRTDGKPVRVVFGRFRRPVIIGPSVVVWPWTIGLHFYNPIKAFVRFVLRIPRGVKGPSWL